MSYKYKTELHCHTKHVSRCAGHDAEGIVEMYLEAGYTSIVITEHLAAGTFVNMQDKSLEEQMEHFVQGYRKVKEAAKGRLNILMGAEVNFAGTLSTDYLIYGLEEEFYHRCPDVYTQNKYWTASLVRNNGGVFIQAHPFRTNCAVTEEFVLDGIEVWNGHPFQKNHNRIAREFAKDYPNYILTSGGDHHDDNMYPDAGILTREPIVTEKQLAEVLRSRDFELICDREARERSRDEEKKREKEREEARLGK